MTYAADPAALQGAVAAGVLGCGTVILGAAREAGALLEHVLKRIDAGATPDEAAEATAREHRAAKKPLAGYGHPLHKPVDPRAERMIALARQRGIAGRGVDAATRLAAAAARVWEKPLPMNVSMAIAATLRDADVPAAIIRGVPILARAAGLIAHLAEEAETPIGFYMASQAEEAIALRRARSRSAEGMSLTEPDVEAAPWEGQAAADDAPYRRQIAYLFERSRFYRDKLGQAGFKSADAVGGLADIARLPFTEKDELRASRSADEPVGTHCAATRDEIVRIYSTSGTTGTPSYIPLTAADVEVWVRTSARSYGASGVKRGDRIVSTYNAGPFVAGAALDAFARLGLCHIPLGTGNTDRLIAGGREAEAERRRVDALLCAASGRMGARRAASISPKAASSG